MTDSENKSKNNKRKWVEPDDSQQARELGIVKRQVIIPDYLADEVADAALQMHREIADKINRANLSSSDNNED